MDPITIGLTAAQFGASALGLFGEQDAAREQVRAANKATRLQNQAAQQQWQYNEQMRQRENRQARALYEMRKQQYNIQKELNYDAYKEYYEDAQVNFNNLVRDVKLKSFQSAAKLAAYQGDVTAQSLARGVTGRRAGLKAGNAALRAGMAQRSRADKLVFAEQQMEKGIKRTARKTDLLNRMAHAQVGPVPEDLPMAPMPIMGSMQRMPSNTGLYTGLLQAGIGAFSTFSSLSAPSAGTMSSGGSSGMASAFT